MSLVQIRRSLVPLEKLQEGTQRIAKRDFETRVTVTSGDEFQDLATSFNAMADHLGRQFSALTTIGSFASISLSGHPGTASMGVLLTIAITLTLVSTLTVLPALMGIFRVGRSP